jgi:hypothetical protein
MNNTCPTSRRNHQILSLALKDNKSIQYYQ